jgi:hypothetical protein
MNFFFPRLIPTGLLSLFLFSPTVSAALTATSGFDPAESGRTHMDIGGVFDGENDVTSSRGDTFTLTIANDGDDPAEGFGRVGVKLPDDFDYFADSASVEVTAGTCSAPVLDTPPATLTGDTLSFNFLTECLASRS